MSTLRPVSNQATWEDSIQVQDADTREALDISTATEITVRLRDPRTCATALEASLSGGTVMRGASAGVLTFTFTDAQMQTLCRRTYEFGVLITFADGSVEQAVLGRLPVLKGL